MNWRQFYKDWPPISAPQACNQDAVIASVHTLKNSQADVPPSLDGNESLNANQYLKPYKAVYDKYYRKPNNQIKLDFSQDNPRNY